MSLLPVFPLGFHGSNLTLTVSIHGKWKALIRFSSCSVSSPPLDPVSFFASFSVSDPPPFLHPFFAPPAVLPTITLRFVSPWSVPSHRSPISTLAAPPAIHVPGPGQGPPTQEPKTKPYPPASIYLPYFANRYSWLSAFSLLRLPRP